MMTPYVLLPGDTAEETAVLVTRWRWNEEDCTLLLYHEDRHIQTLVGEQAYSTYRELHKNTITPVIAEKKKDELCVF